MHQIILKEVVRTQQSLWRFYRAFEVIGEEDVEPEVLIGVTCLRVLADEPILQVPANRVTAFTS